MNNPALAEPENNPPRKSILVVDDDDAVRRGLRGVLVSEGYEVVTASNGVQALAAFRRHPCDLALIDMNMPLLPGWGAIAELRKLSGRLPIIIITARPDQRNIAGAAEVELMEKPLNLPRLLERIDALLNAVPAMPDSPA